MDVIIDYASSVIDISSTVLDYRGGLATEQADQVERIHGFAVDFLTDFMQNSSLPVRELRRYLEETAPLPVLAVIAGCDKLLTDGMDDVDPAYGEAVGQMREYGLALHDEINILHEQVWQFMQDMDLDD